eukprot:scaffold17422_cov103-Cylindrotheca_fusiformis.AAC.6
MDDRPMALSELVSTATSDAQLWSNLLYISGGLLELSKCSVHVVYFQFRSHGQPYLCRLSDIPLISLPDPRTGAAIDIECFAHDREHKTLGHYKAPAGTLPRQRAVIQQAADQMAALMLRSFLDPTEARMVYFAVFLAKFSYVLPQCSFPRTTLREFESKAQQAFTAKMGFNRKMACAIRYGPVSLGGVGLVQFETIQGSGQIQNFLKHWRSYKYIGSLLRCTLAWAQFNAGIGSPILMKPSLPLAHFESHYLQSLRAYLARIDGQLEVDEPYVPPPQRTNDFYLMDVAVLHGSFDSAALKSLNYCRMYLQVVTASDMVLPTCDGSRLDPAMVTGIVGRAQSSTLYCKVNQARPSNSSWKFWQKLCQLLVARLRDRPLGDWLVPGNQLRRCWQCYYDESDGQVYYRIPNGMYHRLTATLSLDAEVFTSCGPPQTWSPTSTCVPIHAVLIPSRSPQMPRAVTVSVLGGIAQVVRSPVCVSGGPRPGATFSEYLATIPTGERLLLDNLDIRIPVHEIISVLHTLPEENVLHQRCTGVSDGSEFHQSMSFGWVLADLEGFRMVTGAGPAFGKQASSYRAEAYGMLSLILFLLHLRIFCASPHNWKLALASDNLGLIKKVKQALQYDSPFPNTTLEPDYDLVHSIVQTIRQAQLEVCVFHVKGHQDRDNIPFDELPLCVQLNIEADELAGEFRQRTDNRVRPK